MKKTTKMRPSCEYLCEFEDNPSISMSSKILVKIHAVIRKLCSCGPIAHVPYCPCAPSPRSPISVSSINQHTPLPMCPTAHVPYCPRRPMSICSIDENTILPMCPIAHVPYCPCALLPKVPHLLSVALCKIPLFPCALLPMCPIAPCALPPRCLTSMCNINHPFTDVPHCPCTPLFMCQKDVKLSKRCQIVKKMSNCQKDVKCQKVKHIDYAGGSQKK